MNYSKNTEYHEQYPSRGAFGPGTKTVNPSYLNIGGSGVVGNFGAESPMSEKNETAPQVNNKSVSMNSGSGAAAGAAATSGGSGVA